MYTSKLTILLFFLAKLFLKGFACVITMARNEISTLIMLLIQAICVQFNDILTDTNDKISQEFLIFCTTNRFKCRVFSVHDLINDIINDLD